MWIDPVDGPAGPNRLPIWLSPGPGFKTSV